MKEFYTLVTETLTRPVVVKAENQEEAEQVFTAKDYVHDEDGVQCDMCGETIEEGDEIYNVYE